VSQSYDIAVIAGDGVGPEVMREGLRVVHAAADRFGFDVNLTEYFTNLK
jgi:isocitrate/isopropylmalate dehydrogenase